MYKNEIKSYLWIEKFRPISTEMMILPSHLKRMTAKLISDGDISNIILYSVSAGTGKTTWAKAICNDIGFNYIFINGSLDNGIDVIRNTIEQFASVKSLDGKPKVVIIDESERLSKNCQDAMKTFLEQFQKSCRFILTCNNINMIIEPIQSRCQLIDFNMRDVKIKEDMMGKISKRLVSILKLQKIEYDINTLNKIIEKYYPDMRSMIKILQQYSDQNGKIDEDIFNFINLNVEFFELILNKKFNDARKYVLDRNFNYSELYSEMYQKFMPIILETQKEKYPQILLILADYAKWHSIGVIDPELHFAACLMDIIGVL